MGGTVAFLGIVQALAIAGFAVVAVRHRPGRLPRGAVFALVLLLVLGDAAILAIVLTHGRELNRGAVPERP